MKVADLLNEGPFHINRDYMSLKMDNIISTRNLNRTNNFLGELEKSGKVFNFWLDNTKSSAKVTVISSVTDPEEQLEVCSLRFHSSPPGLPVNNELQVDVVYTHEKYNGYNLAGILYIILARYGYSVISDFTQYNGGKFLWKKLARESEARKYIVRLWDDENQNWVKKDGEIIKYDANNLDDEEVWKDISFMTSEGTTLFVLSSK